MKIAGRAVPLWLLAPGAAVLVLALAMACAVLGGWHDLPFLQAVAGAGFLLALGVVGVSAVVLLWSRRWAAAAFLLVLFPITLAGGLIGLFLSSLAGRALGMAATGPSELPLPPGAIQEAMEAGRRLATLLSSATGATFESRAFSLRFHSGARRVEFHLATPPPESLAASLKFKQGKDGEWNRDGWSLSGDPATHQLHRKAVEATLREIPLAGWQWPVGGDTETRLLAAANELLPAFQHLAFAPPESNWRLKQVVLRHYPQPANKNSTVFEFEASSAEGPQAWADAEFRYDGREFWLREVTAGRRTSPTSSTSSREHCAMAESALREWIGAGRAPFRAEETPRGWKSATAHLEGGVSLLYEQRPAHIFLAEYHMRVTLSTPGGGARRFVLPMNTGGSTQILVFEGRTAGGARALRLLSPPHFDAAFATEPVQWIETESAGQWQFLGAFLETHAPLAWVPAAAPEALEAFQRAKERGYPAALDAFNSRAGGG